MQVVPADHVGQRNGPEGHRLHRAGLVIREQVLDQLLQLGHFLVAPDVEVLAEFVLRALQLELHYSKDEILTLYVNYAPMGGVLEGVESARDGVHAVRALVRAAIGVGQGWGKLRRTGAVKQAEAEAARP